MEALKRSLRVLKELKRRKTPTCITCPRCGSQRIHRLRIGWLGVTPLIYSCDECGYNGPLILELVKEK